MYYLDLSWLLLGPQYVVWGVPQVGLDPWRAHPAAFLLSRFLLAFYPPKGVARHARPGAMPATPVAIRECRGGHLLASETSDCVELVYHDLRPVPLAPAARRDTLAKDVPSSLEGWHARVEHHAQHAPPCDPVTAL